MSAKKGFQSTKVPVEESMDSGYLSHELSSAPESEEIRPSANESAPVSSTLSSQRSTTHSSTAKIENDSGVISAPEFEEIRPSANESAPVSSTLSSQRSTTHSSMAKIENDSGVISAPESEEIRPSANESAPVSSTLSSQRSTTHSSTAKIENDSDVISECILRNTYLYCDSTQLEDTLVAKLQEDLKKCDISTKVPEVRLSPAPIPVRLPITKVFQQDADGDTVVHITAVHGCKMRTALLIKLCPHPSWLDITNDYGHTALHLAVMSGHPIVARMLVTAGASIAIRDHMGETPLHTAVKSGKRDCLLALLDPVPSRQNDTVRDAVLNQTNYHGQACVHIAARRGDVEMLQTLVHYRADINVKDGCAGWTALHIAASAGHEAVSRFLLELRSPRVHRHATSYAGRTPLRLARRTALYSYYLKTYEYQDNESATESEDDGEDFLERHASFPVAVST